MTPEYGTCPVCGKGLLLNANGQIRRHKHRRAGQPRYEATDCAGSGQASAGRPA